MENGRRELGGSNKVDEKISIHSRQRMSAETFKYNNTTTVNREEERKTLESYQGTTARVYLLCRVLSEVFVTASIITLL